MIKVKRINNEVVKPMRIAEDMDKRPPRGEALISAPYANIFACARKKTGKTSVIAKLIMQCVGKDTQVHIFCSTVFIDETYIALGKWLDKHNIAYYPSTSIKEGPHDLLNDIMLEDEDFMNAGEDEDNPDPEPKIKLLDLSTPPPRQRKAKPSKFREIRRLFVFDDLSTDIRNSNSLKQLLKKNRHLKSKVIISSQYPNDLDPQSWSQLDYVFLFKYHNEEKLREIHLKLDLCIPFDVFVQIYNLCTHDKTKFDFLYIDRYEQYRKSFNKLLIIEEQ